jgi:tetratricopeptide (TPR) repeat protein
MRLPALSIAFSALLFAVQLPAQVQSSSGPCSPNIANVSGPVTINFAGSGCGSIDPADLKMIKDFLTDYPGFQKDVLKQLSRGDQTMRLLVKQEAQVASETRAANKTISERLDRLEIQANGPPPVRRALQANDQDRRAAVETIGEIEGILKNAGLGLSAQNLAAVGWLFEIGGNHERAAASFLAAKDADPSLAGKVYLGLAVSYQLQGYQFLQKGDLDNAETILAKAEDNARLAQQYEPAESSEPLMQLGFINKDLANTYAAENRRAKAEAALASAATLFQQVLGANPKDPGAHNGLGGVDFARGQVEQAISEYEAATSLQPDYTYAWHDLALALYTKYTRAAAPDKNTLGRMAIALQKVFELEQSPNAQKLPPGSLEGMLKIKDFVVAEAKKFPTGQPDN